MKTLKIKTKKQTVKQFERALQKEFSRTALELWSALRASYELAVRENEKTHCGQRWLNMTEAQRKEGMSICKQCEDMDMLCQILESIIETTVQRLEHTKLQPGEIQNYDLSKYDDLE